MSPDPILPEGAADGDVWIARSPAPSLIAATDYVRRGDKLISITWPGWEGAVDPAAEASRLDLWASAEGDAAKADALRAAAAAIRAEFKVPVPGA